LQQQETTIGYANEAPPAIISVFIGAIDKVLAELEALPRKLSPEEKTD
jgi:glutamine synthetase type III